MRNFIVAALLAPVCVSATAASMNKCIDAQGHVTFTQQACPGGGAGERLNVTSQSAGMLVGQPPSPSNTEETPADPTPAGARVTVVGGDGAAACGDATEQEIRTAIVKHKVFPGMTAKQVIQSWGPPSSINQGSRGDDQWVYDRGSASSQYIYVDQSGCVTAWN